MVSERTGEAQPRRGRGALIWLGRTLLLIPEGVVIAALLCAYWALESPPLGLLVVLLIVSFITRMLALLGARMSLDAARYREAEALAQVALGLYPWSADALALRGAIALARGAAATAELALRRALALLPGQPSFHAALAGALLDLGRPAEAAASARQALAIDERCAVAYLYLAEAERASGAPAETVEERLRAGLALAVAPASEAALRCALGEHLLAERRMAEASLTIHGVEALLPRCPALRQVELRVRLGELLIAQGQIERAREHFRSVEEIDPNGRYAGATWRASHL
jgi:tetratricopeptide (TPR) repeat protein